MKNRTSHTVGLIPNREHQVPGSRDFNQDYDNTILLGLTTALAEVQQAESEVGDEGSGVEEGGGEVRDDAERRDAER